MIEPSPPTPAALHADAAKLLREYERLVFQFGADSEPARSFREKHANSKEFMELAQSVERLHRAVASTGTGTQQADARLQRRFFAAIVTFAIVSVAISILLGVGLFYTWRYHEETEQFNSKTKQFEKDTIDLKLKTEELGEKVKESRTKVVRGSVRISASIENRTDELSTTLNLTPAERAVVESLRARKVAIIPEGESVQAAFDEVIRDHTAEVVLYLKDPDPNVRLATAKALRSFLEATRRVSPEIRDAAPDIVQLLLDDGQKLEYYRSAIDVLKAIGAPAVLPLRKALRESTNDKSRGQGDIIAALGKIGKDAAGAVDEIIAKGVDHSESGVRWRAVTAIGEIGPAAKAATAKIRLFLTEPANSDPMLKQLSIEALYKLKANDQETVRAVTNTLKNIKENADVRANAAEALQEIGRDDMDAHAALVAALGDADTSVRKKSAASLGKVGRAVLPKLLSLLNDYSRVGPEVRQGAIVAIGSMDKVSLEKDIATVVDKLTAVVDDGINLTVTGLLKSSKVDEQDKTFNEKRLVAVKAIEALGNIGKFVDMKSGPARRKRMEGSLAEGLQSQDPLIFRATVSSPLAMELIPSRTIATLQTRMQSSADPIIRTDAAEALGRIGLSTADAASKVVVPLLLGLKDPDFAVRTGAHTSLTKIMERHNERPIHQAGILPTETNEENGGKYYRVYEIPLSSAKVYQIDVKSKAFDAYLYIKRKSDGQTVAFDDDSGGDRNARVFFAPKSSFDYQIWVTTYASREIGAYDLEIRELPRNVVKVK